MNFPKDPGISLPGEKFIELGRINTLGKKINNELAEKVENFAKKFKKSNEFEISFNELNSLKKELKKEIKVLKNKTTGFIAWFRYLGRSKEKQELKDLAKEMEDFHTFMLSLKVKFTSEPQVLEEIEAEKEETATDVITGESPEPADRLEDEQIIAEPEEEQIIAEPEDEQIIAEPEEEQIIAKPEEEQIIAKPADEQALAETKAETLEKSVEKTVVQEGAEQTTVESNEEPVVNNAAPPPPPMPGAPGNAPTPPPMPGMAGKAATPLTPEEKHLNAEKRKLERLLKERANPECFYILAPPTNEAKLEIEKNGLKELVAVLKKYPEPELLRRKETELKRIEDQLLPVKRLLKYGEQTDLIQFKGKIAKYTNEELRILIGIEFDGKKPNASHPFYPFYMNNQAMLDKIFADWKKLSTGEKGKVFLQHKEEWKRSLNTNFSGVLATLKNRLLPEKNKERLKEPIYEIAPFGAKKGAGGGLTKVSPAAEKTEAPSMMEELQKQQAAKKAKKENQKKNQ